MALRLRSNRSAPTGTVAPRKHDINEVITIRLGDFSEALPKQLLVADKVDDALPINFEIPKLAKQIIEGRMDVPLAEIYRQAPGIFASEIKPADNHPLRFPWVKLAEMLRAAPKNTSEPGLTRAGALHLARLLRGFRGVGTTNRAGSTGSPRATQPLNRNGDGADISAEDRILEELAAVLEQFVPGGSPSQKPPADHIETSEAFAITVEENTKLRKDIEERDREIEDRDHEIESLRKTLAELETAAIDQIAALNEQCEEYETAHVKPAPESEEKGLNPQQTAMIESLSQQVAELYEELDRAREETLEATAAHARYRELQESSGVSPSSTQQYLTSAGHELGRANSLLKEMEAKNQYIETMLASREAELKRLAQEQLALQKLLADVCIERDALRGRLYATSPDTSSNP